MLRLAVWRFVRPLLSGTKVESVDLHTLNETEIMSTVYKCSTPEPFGFDYDAADFDLEILDELDLLNQFDGKLVQIA